MLPTPNANTAPTSSSKSTPNSEAPTSIFLPVICPLCLKDQRYIFPSNTANNRSSWEPTSTTRHQGTLFVHPSVPLSLAWTLVLVVTLLPCAHKDLVWKSFLISKP